MQRILVATVVVEDNKLLVVKEASRQHHGKYNFPAGHLDQGESIFKATIREAKEETGFDIRIKGLLVIHNFLYGKNNDQALAFIFQGERVGGEIQFDKKEILSAEWVSVTELEKMTEKELRNPFLMHKTLEALKSNKLYPLEVIEEFI